MILAGSVVVAIAVIAVVVGLALGSGSVTIHGTLEVDDFTGQCLNDPGFSDLTAGTQVVVKDSTGTVIGTGALGFNAQQTQIQSSLQPGLSVCIYPFTVTGVQGGEPRYGIEVSHRGTVWFSAKQITKPVGLLVSSGGTGF